MSATVIALAERRPPPEPSRPLMTPEERDRALHAELRLARIRIARLEEGLGAAVRAARAAERRLAELTGRATG